MSSISYTNKRNDIFCAALQLIAENGFHRAPIAMIAHRANVSTGTIYRYFTNKDVLITELYGEIESKIYHQLLQQYVATMSIKRRFFCLGTSLLRYFINNPLHFHYIEQFNNSPYGVMIRRDWFLIKKGKLNVYRELFDEGVKNQVIKDLPLPVLFSLAFGPVLGVARDHILGFTSLNDALITRVIEASYDSVLLSRKGA